MSELIRFWPSSEALTSVMASQAEALEQQAFLAVHQPMTFRRQDNGAANSSNRSEADLLEFLLRDTGDGCVITVVLGRSGVGKSHAIRWLYETVHALEGSDRYVLVWVPRTRSAKGVLSDLLELPGFDGDEWDDLRVRVGAATDGLSVARAARLLQAEMVLALQERPGPELPKAIRTFVDQVGREFADFVQDPNVWPIPADSQIQKSGTAADLSPWIRLAKHLVAGDVDPDDRGARLFLDSDLDFPVDLGGRIGAQAIEFWELLQTHGHLLDGNLTLRQAAREVLNSLLDSAKASVLGVNQTPISDLFIQLRQKLHAEGRELVLLIEDMTIMSGLQRSLLDVMVQPSGAPDGRRLCPIRTALALTPGFMQGGALPDNVMTRAVAEWWVEEELDEKQILLQYEGLAAGYLNAARHVTAGSTPSADLFDVVDGEDDADLVEAVRAFGRHRTSNRPLFPFNRSAIEVLAREKVQSEGRLIYNPRRFLNLVLQPLLVHRDEFEASTFPSERVNLPVLKSSAVSAAIRAGATGDEAVRLDTVIAAWGGQPSSWEQALKLPAPLFRAFGLTPPDGTAEGPPEPQDTSPEPEPNTDDIDARDPIEGLVAELEEWGSKATQKLSQKTANDVRKALADLLVEVLPRGWPGLSRLVDLDLRKLIHIHSAMGNNQLTPETAAMSFPLAKPPKSRAKWKPFVSELIALLRWHKSDRNGLDYYDAVGTFPVLLSLADRLAREAAVNLFNRFGPPAAEDSLKNASSLLLLAAQANGGRTSGALEVRLEDLFNTGSAESLPASMPVEVRRVFRALVEATGTGSGVRKHLLAYHGAFQGAGNTPHAVDASELLRILRGVAPGIPKTAVLNNLQPGLADELVPAVREVKGWYQNVFSVEVKAFLHWFGGDSPRTLRDEVLALAEQALERGQVVHEAKAVLRHKEQLDASAARSLVALLSSLDEWDPLTLATLHSIDWVALSAWQAFVSRTDEFLEVLERELRHQGNTTGIEVKEGIISAFEAQLDLVSNALEG